MLYQVIGSITPVTGISKSSCIFMTDLSIKSSKSPDTLTPGIFPNFLHICNKNLCIIFTSSPDIPKAKSLP